MKNLTALLEQLKLAQPIIDDNKNSNEKTCVNINFTQKEINKMPKTFRKEFRTDGCTARVYKRKVSKNAFTYDIKYRRNGYSVFVTDRNLESAKQKFIEKLKTAEKINKRTTIAPTTFNSFAMFHFENFRKKRLKKKPMKTICQDTKNILNLTSKKNL